ncbi:MAG TPA: hypothetical protein VG452_06310 [Egibacteraceae bacterium]|nr:hypothetical protein [Egibacteraceae bacterium]
MAQRFRDRFFTPAVARAITSPSAILLAGAGAAVAIAAGLPAAAVAAVGAAAYAGRVALAVPRRSPAEHVDYAAIDALGQPWSRFWREALDARKRYQRAVAAAEQGPLRQRLADIGERIDTGVRECVRIARRGAELDRALHELEPPGQVRQRLAELERERAAGGPGSQRLGRTVQALAAQLESTERIAAVARDTRDRLRLLDARLDEAVARAVELSLRAGDPIELGGLGDDVDSLVGEMETLRQALEETGGTTAYTT